jgi:hypothetical protein
VDFERMGLVLDPILQLHSGFVRSVEFQYD